MIKFKEFLTEQEEVKKLKHIEHPEDLHIDSGHAGFKHAVEVLNKSKKHVEQGKQSSDLTVKYDGSPSVVYGHHPETGKFFVATKSAFNKNPKLNYSNSDIEANHGHAPGLVSKLKSALKHLPKIAPKSGVFQGDLMHTPEDHTHKNGSVSFKPNTITYTAHGEEAAKAKRSKLGIATHTQYHGKDLESMSAEPIKSHEGFSAHADVHHISPTYHGSGKNLTPEQSHKFNSHLATAAEHDTKTDHEKIAPMREHIKTYINATVRTGEKPSVGGLKSHVAGKFQKEIDKVTTAKAKGAKTEKMNAALEHISQNDSHFTNALKTHEHVQAAKNILVHHMNRDYSGFEHHLGDKNANPEGYVASHKGQLTKLVDRAEFSAANFAPRG